MNLRNRKTYQWNPVYNIVMQVKDQKKSNSDIFKEWLIDLENQELINFFAPIEINQFGSLVLIRYGLHEEALETMWTDKNSPYREARSLVIDIEDESIVLCPFRKAFNVNEIPENSVENLKKEIKDAFLVEIADKLDGSMQSASFHKGKIVMSGSQALNPEQSWRLKDGMSMLTENHKLLISSNPDHTFIFEYISIADQHVVAYTREEEGLYLIGIRRKKDGFQEPYMHVKEIAKAYNVKKVKTENKTLDQLLEEMKTIQANEKEGWFLNIDGHMVKIKGDDYVSIHRLLDFVSSPNVIIRAIADNTYDDLISKVPLKNRDRVTLLADLIFKYLTDSKQSIKEWYNKAPKENTKEFMIYINQNAPKHLIPYIRNEYLGKEYNLLSNQYGKFTSYKNLKQLNLHQEYINLKGDYYGIKSEEKT